MVVPEVRGPAASFVYMPPYQKRMDWLTAEGHPQCFYNRTCRPFNISAFVPLDWALPLYGYWMPIIVCLTLATNSFIVLVLSHKYLRTPTNYVLLAMAVSELFTGISCIPWFIYYFTLGGYRNEAIYGLPEFWCRVSPYVAAILPSIFHSTAIWLTVYLAIQRYVYICVPTLVRRFCTLDRSRQVTVIICIFSVLIYTPELMASYTFSHTLFDPVMNISRRLCYKQQTAILRSVGNLYYKTLYIGQCTLVHLMPCVLLVIFTWKLVNAIRVADRRHAYLLARASNRIEKRSVMVHDPDEAAKRLSHLSKPRESISEPRRVQGLKQNTRMLVVVILIFLITEIPAAIIFIIHVLSVSLSISIISYKLLNVLLIVRNVLIVSSYPFRFAIYCGMSQQFRDVVKQMFTGRFFPQLIGDKDNSTTMVLVHVEKDSEARSALVVQNGKNRNSIAKSSILQKPNEKWLQCNLSESSELVPFDPYLSDLNVLMEVPSEFDIYTAWVGDNQRDVSTQVECRLALIASRRESMLTAALKEQCQVMLQQAL